MGVLKKTIGISSKKSLKVFRPRRSLGNWSSGQALSLEPEKKIGGPWPLAPYFNIRKTWQPLAGVVDAAEGEGDRVTTIMIF